MFKNVFFSQMPIPVKSESCGNRGWWRGRDCCGCQQSRHFASLSRRLSTIPLFSHRKCQNWTLRAKWKVLRKMFLLRLRQKSLGMPKLEFIQVIRNFLACGLKCVGRFSCTGGVCNIGIMRIRPNQSQISWNKTNHSEKLFVWVRKKTVKRKCCGPLRSELLVVKS